MVKTNRLTIDCNEHYITPHGALVIITTVLVHIMRVYQYGNSASHYQCEKKAIVDNSYVSEIILSIERGCATCEEVRHYHCAKALLYCTVYWLYICVLHMIYTCV